MANDIPCPVCNGVGQITDFDGLNCRECDQCNGSGLANAEDYTCFECGDVETCKYRYDSYNTGGDCLASK